MKKKYTKKQITEAISYWEQKLALEEAFEELNSALLKESKLNEEDAELMMVVKDQIENEVKKPEDVEKFIVKNDQNVKKAGIPVLSKAWELLKKIVKLGARGLKWIVENWKVVLIVLMAAALAYAYIDPSGAAAAICKMILKGTVKAVEVSMNALADGFAWLTGPEYMQAGEKISNAAIDAGGYGGWSGAGLGGGLR